MPRTSRCASRGSCDGSAERAGFEPATRLSTRTRFPVALLRPLGHLSGRATGYPTAERGLARGRLDHVRGHVLDLFSSSCSAKAGIAPMPFVTRSTTSAASGFASSRFGPIVPDAPGRLERVAAAAAGRGEDRLAGRRVASGRRPPALRSSSPGRVSPVSVPGVSVASAPCPSSSSSPANTTTPTIATRRAEPSQRRTRRACCRGSRGRGAGSRTRRGARRR